MAGTHGWTGSTHSVSVPVAVRAGQPGPSRAATAPKAATPGTVPAAVAAVAEAVATAAAAAARAARWAAPAAAGRSEEHTSELQSRGHLVCRLLLEKKKYNKSVATIIQVMDNS